MKNILKNSKNILLIIAFIGITIGVSTNFVMADNANQTLTANDIELETSVAKCGEGKCGSDIESDDTIPANVTKCGDDQSAEKKCGEGKCGNDRVSSNKETCNKEDCDNKCGDGKCGDDSKNTKCGEGKCGGEDSKAMDNVQEAKCGDDNSEEAKCGAGKCG